MFPKIVSVLFLSLTALNLLSNPGLAQLSKDTQINSVTSDKFRKAANEIAEKFIKRWHESLDLAQLQEEFFIKDVKLWRNVVRRELKEVELGLIKGCDRGATEQNNFLLLKQNMLSVATLLSLMEEYDIYYYGLSNEIRIYPDDIESIGMRFQRLLNEEDIILEEDITRRGLKDTTEVSREITACDEQLQRFLSNLITAVEASSALFRQHLPKGIFAEEQYRQRLKDVASREEFEKSEDDSEDDDLEKFFRDPDSSSSMPQIQEVATGAKKKIIRIQKGIFTLAFIEEEGAMKILFALPTRLVN